MDIHAIGDFLLNLSIVTAIFCAAASVVGKWRSHGRLMLAGERAGYAVTAMVVTASFLLISAFITHD